MGRTPVIRQTEAAECGLACVAMIASHFGHATTLQELRQRFLISIKGMTLQALMRCGEKLGLSSRPLRVGLDRIQDLAMPCILHWDMNHFVVLVRARGTTLTIHDPALGVRTITREDANVSFTGVAIELYPGTDFVRRERSKRYSVLSLFGRTPGFARGLIALAIMTVMAEALMLFVPLLTQLLVDRVIPSKGASFVWTVAAAFAVLVVLQAAVSALRGWTIASFGAELTFSWMRSVFFHLVKLPLAWFEKRQLGEVLNKFGAIRVVQQTVGPDAVRAVFDGVLSILTLALMLTYGLAITGLAVAFVGLYMVHRMALQRWLHEASEAELAAFGKQNTSLLETMRGIQAIRLSERGAARAASWLNMVADQLNAQVKLAKVGIVLRIGGDLVHGLSRVAVVSFAAYLAIAGEMTVGAMLAFVAYREQFSTRVIALIDQVVIFKLLTIQTDRIADIVHSPTERVGGRGATPPALVSVQPGLAIELRDVHFAYSPGEREILWNIGMHVEAGECVAIVGDSGCGKTTLLKVLLGLLPPSSGVVMADGQDIRDLGLQDYRLTVGCVMQDDVLFSGTIADNISFFDPQADKAWVVECAKRAAIDFEIQQMPMKYSTLIGDIGIGLSGGQKQRILLARALYRRPRLLVLDEASSHLDLRTEGRINAALREIKATRIMVAHRPETIAIANRRIEFTTLFGMNNVVPMKS